MNLDIERDESTGHFGIAIKTWNSQMDSITRREYGLNQRATELDQRIRKACHQQEDRLRHRRPRARDG